MTMTALQTTMQRAVLLAISAVALIGSVLTWIFMALHISSLRSNPGAILSMARLEPPELERIIPAGMQYQLASALVEVDVVAQGESHDFLPWQIAAWVSRYGLAIVFLLSVVYLCWRLWRRSGVLGRVTSLWVTGLAGLTLAVAFFAPWALIHAHQLVARAVAAPTSAQEGGDTWFVIPQWSLQDADWWLVLFSALLTLLAVLLHRARGAERETEGLI